SNESIAIEGAGSYYVSVRGYSAATFDLTITFTTSGGTSGGTPEPPATTNLNESGHVNQGDWNRFTLTVTAGQSVTVRTTAPADVDLYTRMDTAPTLNEYDQRGWTSSGNETLTFTAAAAGTLHIGVMGYAGSDYTLVTE
ncbi:MAG: PPC domain-containing protein, partial [Candidatus Poribacteria bacterium]